MTKLKPCPFCKGKVKFMIQDYASIKWISGVQCKTCQHNIYFFERGRNVSLETSSLNDQKEIIAKFWNRRNK